MSYLLDESIVEGINKIKGDSLESSILEDIGLSNDGDLADAPDVEDITKAVDEDGKPLDDDEQREERIIEESEMPVELNYKFGMEDYSVDPTQGQPEDPKSSDANRFLPYCPVKICQIPGQGIRYCAYLTGTVLDVENYVDLIDTLIMASPKDEYYIFIDSPGGMIASGGIIASAIHHSRAKVYTVARGICASAAALIHSAAKKENQLVGDFAVMMYHMSSHFDMGSSTKILERAANQVRYVNECLLNKALADGHFTQDEFNKIQTGEEIFIPASEFLRRVGR